MDKFVFVYFESIDRLAMFADSTLGVIGIDQLMARWALGQDLDYDLLKIEITTGKPRGLIGYRLQASDAILFKMEYTLAKTLPFDEYILRGSI